MSAIPNSVLPFCPESTTSSFSGAKLNACSNSRLQLPSRAAGVLSAVLALLVLAACAPRNIPNTQIRDTRDNREILEIVSRYKQAFEAQDAQAIAALASPRYLDARDNVSYDTLISDLEQDFEQVRQVQLDIAVRRIEVEKDTAYVDYFYSSNVLIKSEGEDRWRTQTDDKRMILVNEEGRWKVLSGF